MLLKLFLGVLIQHYGPFGGSSFSCLVQLGWTNNCTSLQNDHKSTPVSTETEHYVLEGFLKIR